MSRQAMFMRLLVKAAWMRKARAFTALLSIAVVATMATVALTIYSNLESKLSREFRNFGANVVLTKHEGALTREELARIDAVVAGEGQIVPVAYAVGSISNRSKVVVGGADLNHLRQLNSWWSAASTGSGNALVGSRVDDSFGHGSSFTIAFPRSSVEIHPQAVFRSGSDDDSRIYLPLETFIQLTGIQPNTALLRIDGTPPAIQSKVQELTTSLPGIEVNPVRQITAAQAALLGRTRSIVLVASAVVIVLIVLCMVTTLTGSVLERRKDFAVMKALGASDRAVNILFAGEAALLSVIGAIVGFLVGAAVAYWIGRSNFGAAIAPSPETLVPVVLGSVALALITSSAPLNLLRRIQPAGILRGE